MKNLMSVMVLVATLAAGCASRGTAPVAVYDFGLAPASTSSGQSVFIADVRSADWLETTDMLYRLGYRDARGLARFGSSRWAGAPGAMLTVRLRQSAGSALTSRSRQAKCTLSLNLSEFSQVFDSESSSRAVMHLQASLAENQTAGRFVGREFRIEKIARTTDAAGGAAAFAQIVDELTRQIDAWVLEAAFCKA
jgi:cholesterol transport system auxiliary component